MKHYFCILLSACLLSACSHSFLALSENDSVEQDSIEAGSIEAGSIQADSIEADSIQADRFEIYGRTLSNDAGHVYISWPGTSIEGRFTGSSLSVTLDDERGDNYFNVFIDGNTSDPFIIEAKKGKHTYLISDQLGKGKHLFELYKRTEGHEGGTWFLGVELAGNARLLSPPSRPKRRIAFFGDSITSGKGNEADIDKGDDVLAEKNNYLSYGSVTARALNAEHQTISLSGIGIMISWFDIIMPNYYDQISGIGDNETRWSFEQWQPQVVVINLTQNDSWLIDKRKRLKPHPSGQDIINAYVEFVSKVQAAYPKAYYICALGSMDAVRPGSPWPGYVRAAVEQLRDQNSKIDIDSLFFDYTGFNPHPRVQHHKHNAEKLTKAISDKMGW